MNYDEILQFQGLTGLESFDEINYWLEMGGKSLENALEMYFAHMNMGNSDVASSSSSIRKPDQVKRARLVSEVDDMSAWYAPPQDLLTYETFEMVKSRAREHNKWLLVNIQRETEFACHELNRDFWGNESIKELVKCSFVFWQQLDISDEGGSYVRLYKIGRYPYVGILHPSTGAVVWSKEAVTATLLYDKLQDFIGQHPSPDSYLSARRRDTYAEPEVEHLTQIVPSLKAPDSFHFIPMYIHPNPSSSVSASSSGSVRIKIKMTNGHVFLRCFNLDDTLMKLIQEIISQISQQDYSKPFDVFYDHPQKSLAAEARTGSRLDELDSLRLSTLNINNFLNHSTFRSVGMVLDQVVLVRLAEE